MKNDEGKTLGIYSKSLFVNAPILDVPEKNMGTNCEKFAKVSGF